MSVSIISISERNAVLNVTPNNPIVNIVAGFAFGGTSDVTATNIGTGEGVFKQRLSSVLQLKSLVAGTNISIVNNTNDLTINAVAPALSSILAFDNSAGSFTIEDLGAPVNPNDAARKADLPTTLPPNGLAGGELEGSYPNPSIKTQPALTAGTYGDGTHYPVVTVNSKGIITSASQLLIPEIGGASGTAGGDLTGTYPNPTIGLGKVTYAKIQNITANRLLGRVGTTGTIQEITLGSNFTFTGTTLDLVIPPVYAWLSGGNPSISEQAFGTQTAFDIPVIVNNSEIMRFKVGGLINLTSTSQNNSLDNLLAINPSGDIYYRSATTILVDGQGTTANGAATDLGGNITADVNITGTGVEDFNLNDLASIKLDADEITLTQPLLQDDALTELLVRDPSTGIIKYKDSMSAGTVTGTGVSGRATFWSGTNSLSSDASFIFNSTDKILKSNRFSSLLSADPSGSVTDGDLYYNSTALDYRARINGYWSNITRPEINPVSATTYTFAESDRNKIVIFTSVSGCTANFPNGLSESWLTSVYRASTAGVITFTADTTLESTGTTLPTASTGATFFHKGSNVIVGLGAFTAASGGAVWGSITGTITDQTDLQIALDAKQDILILGTDKQIPYMNSAGTGFNYDNGLLYDGTTASLNLGLLGTHTKGILKGVDGGVSNINGVGLSILAGNSYASSPALGGNIIIGSGSAYNPLNYSSIYLGNRTQGYGNNSSIVLSGSGGGYNDLGTLSLQGDKLNAISGSVLMQTYGGDTQITNSGGTLIVGNLDNNYAGYSVGSWLRTDSDYTLWLESKAYTPKPINIINVGSNINITTKKSFGESVGDINIITATATSSSDPISNINIEAGTGTGGGANGGVYIKNLKEILGIDGISIQSNSSYLTVDPNYVGIYANGFEVFSGGDITLGVTGSIKIQDALPNDDAIDELVVRDPSTGELKYRSASSISGGGGGGVSSVGMSVPSFLSVSGSPITSSGTLAVSYSGTALPVANGGTGRTNASITSFNNITGYTASGATGTTSTNLVFSASPTFTGTPVLPTAFTIGANSLTRSGAHNLTLTTTATTTVTLPVSGTLYSTGTTDVSVADGGTGRSTSTTAYGLIAAGTTATGAHQTISPGTGGYLLKSNGTSSLATFVDPTTLTVGITNALKSATTTVDVSAATAPSSGQVLTATSSTTATWQTPTTGGGITNSASNHELMLSDGTNAIGSGLLLTGSILSGVSAFNGTIKVSATGSSATRRLESEENTSGSSSILYPLRVSTVSSVSTVAGFGTGIEFYTQTIANKKIGSTIESIATTVTSGNEYFALSFKIMSAGATASEKLRLTSSGATIYDSVYLGDTGTSGTSRTINTDGLSADVGLGISTKGNGKATINASTVGITTNTGQLSEINIDPSYLSPTISNTKHATQNGFFNFKSASGTSTNVAPDGIAIIAGSAYSVSGNGNGGNILIRSGQRRVAGSGADGNITIDALTGYLILANIPTSSAGLPTGAIWSNLGILTIV